jgi:hypothetical protein
MECTAVSLLIVFHQTILSPLPNFSEFQHPAITSLKKFLSATTPSTLL